MTFSLSRMLLGTAFCLSVCGAGAWGQSYRIEVHGQEEGLQSSEINSIAQDGRARLWLATRLGLFSFDGIQWENHQPLQAPGNSFSLVRADASGRIWAINEINPYSVAWYEESAWQKLPPLEAFPSYTITGLAVLLRPSGPHVAVSSSQSGLAIWDSQRWSHLPFPETGRIHGLATLKQSFYLATDRGLLRHRQGRLEEVPVPSPRPEDRAVLAICPDPEGESLWIHGSGWLASWGESQPGITYEGDKLRLPDSAGSRLAAGRDGWVYLAENERLLQILPESGQIFPLGRENGLTSEGARTLFVDGENSLWLANRMGLVRVAGRRFANFDTRQGLLEDEVTAIVQLSPDEMILGHNTGLTFWKAGQAEKVSFPKVSEGWKGVTRALDMRLDSKGRVWVAASWAGLACIEGGAISWYGPESGLTVPVTSVLQDRSGSLWVAANRQLFRKEGQRFVPSAVPGVTRGAIRRIFEGRQGALYLGTSSHGLMVGRPGSWRLIASLQHERSESIYALLEDSQGRHWAGTGGGLYRIDSGQMVPAPADVFPDPRPVYSILEDGAGTLWFGTDSGVTLWDGRRSRRLTTREGLAGLETNRAAALLDTQGRVWIGTDRGLSLYQPQFDRFEPSAPQVEVLSAWAAGEDLDLSREVSLGAAQNTLQFGFRALTLQDPLSIQYRFRLEGFDEQWQHQDNPYQRQVRYASLPPGRFRLNVEAGSPQNWGPSAAGPWIVIRPPFYLQWWFAPAVLASLLLAGYLALLQKSRKELHRRYRRLVEEAPEAILLFDPEKDRFVAANPNAGRLLQTDKRQLLRMGWSDCSPARQPDGQASAPASAGLLEQALEGAEPVFEWVFRDWRDRELPCEVRLTRFASGRRLLVRVSAHDISRRKRLEAEARRSLHEKELLLQEIHHRVKNNLQVVSSLLSLQARRASSGGEALSLNQSRNRIRAMALIHERLYRSRDLRQIDFHEYLNSLTSNLIRANALPGRISVQVQAQNVRFDVDTAVPCGLIVNELVTNAIQHAFTPHQSGHIKVKVNQEQSGGFSITVEDDGCGLPEGLCITEGESLGLVLVRSLTQQLNGTLDVANGPAGSCFQIRFRSVYYQRGAEVRSAAAVPFYSSRKGPRKAGSSSVGNRVIDLPQAAGGVK